MTTVAPSVHLSGAAMLEGRPLFDQLDLTMGAQSWTCLLGSSGVGKTTILRLIAGLDTAAIFDGQITASDNTPLDGRIAYMAQTDLLLPWASVLDNVCLGAHLRGQTADKDKAEAIIARVGLTAHKQKKPATLSGGQRQRAALARTLMEDRPIVLLDEPFSALDSRTRSEMQELAAEMLDGRTILLVTHDPGEAARLGHVIYIMSSLGLETADSLSPPLPRSFSDKDVLALQSTLLTQLRNTG
jgi:putative hydroxymethylpyrimidine transport system ATP-binding protein